MQRSMSGVFICVEETDINQMHAIATERRMKKIDYSGYQICSSLFTLCLSLGIRNYAEKHKSQGREISLDCEYWKANRRTLP